MIIGYARVSTREQNLDRQIEALTAAGVERIYTDKISTRRDWRDRPQWSKMWEALRPGDVLTVAELDRMGRDVRDLLNVVQSLEKMGVSLRILGGVFASADTSTGLGRLLFHIAAGFAEYERSVNRTRTLDGLQAARARGISGGRPPKLTPLEVDMLLSLYRDPSVTTAAIARQFRIKPDTVRAYARRNEGLQIEKARNLSSTTKESAITDEAVLTRNANYGKQPVKAPPSPQTVKKGRGIRNRDQ